MRFDATGKVSLTHIYTEPDPRPYFTALRELDYRVPQLAKPYFAKLIEEYRQFHPAAAPRVLDVGSSYGINGALLKCDTTMEELYERYAGPHSAVLTRDELLRRDRTLLRSRRSAPEPHITGLDTSAAALGYGRAAGFLDAAVAANLEEHPPDARQRRLLRGTDLVISTGCLGYVTERTLERVILAQGPRRPWMAHFVLRMFPFQPVEEMLARYGYRTVRIEGVFRQRRFSSPEEQTQVLATMAQAGVDPSGLEADGWLHAELYVSRPAGPERPGRPADHRAK